MMNAKKTAWWIVVSVIVFSCFWSLLLSILYQNMQTEQIDKFNESVRDNPKQWESITIGDREVKAFQKDLILNNGAVVISSRLSSCLMLLLLLLVSGTWIYKEKNKK